MPKSKNIVEIKMMQRHGECDLNAMLLCAFQFLVYHRKNSREDGFEKNFFSRCFYCGCVYEQSGEGISYFVIPKVSFAIFIHYINKYFRDDPNFKKNYKEQLLIDTFKALQNGLRNDEGKNEKVIIYDDKKAVFVLPKQNLQDNDDFRKFIKPFRSLTDRKISKLRSRPDNFQSLYNKLKEKMPLGKELRFFFTLYDDKEPADIYPVIKKENLTFCKRTYRREKRLCSTKEYFLREITDANRDQTVLGNELAEKFRIFLGLSV